MGKAKKGKIEALRCTCPTCKTDLIVDFDGEILRSYYEPDQAKADEKAKEFLPTESKEESGGGGAGETTAPPDKTEQEKEEADDLETEAEPKNSKSDFGLGDW